MEDAKASVKKFLSRDGGHDTTVHESTAPAVTHENISRQQHENVMPVVDREVHQDHHHTSVQPVQDSKVLPEQHHHKAMPVETRSFEHDNHDNVKSRLAEERAQFGDKQTRVEGERTTQEAGVMTGEHKHHHVHETIQPIVQRETVEPHVHHTVVPVHETHHNPTQHHSSTALPPVSMSEFKQQGGALTGREERSDHFQGEPKTFGGGNSALGSDRHATGREEVQDGVKGQPRTLGGALGSTGQTGRDGNLTDETRGLGRDRDTTGGLSHNREGINYADNGMNRGADHGAGHGLERNTLNDGTSRRDEGLDRRDDIHRDHHTGTGVSDPSNYEGQKPTPWKANTSGFQDGHGSNTAASNIERDTGAATHKKPSLLDKLNPKKDSDGDGKAGFMK